MESKLSSKEILLLSPRVGCTNPRPAMTLSRMEFVLRKGLFALLELSSTSKYTISGSFQLQKHLE